MRYMLVLVIALAATCLDITFEKISNECIIFFWLTGLFYQLVTHGIVGGLYFFSGALIPLVILFLLFVFRMLGAGDIKLLSALGGIMGAGAVIKCIAVSFLVGAVLSAAFIVVCGNLRQRLRYFADYFNHFANTKEISPYYKPGRQVENIHFSIPILLSVMLYAGGFY